MAHRQKPPHRSQPALPPPLAAVTRRAAGSDVGAAAQDVAGPPSDDAQPVRRFDASPVDGAALADWWAACGITTVALDSTGGSWSPLLALGERRGCEGLVVDPQQVQKITGRPQSAGHACQGRPRLQTFGRLAGACRPPAHGCVLRRALRQRALFLSSARQHIPHRQQALTPLHRKRQHVVSDVTGETGMAMIRAMLAGEGDPVQLARLRHDRCHHDAEPIATALHGRWRAAPLVAVAHAVARDALSHEQSVACDRPIEAALETFAACQDRGPMDVRGSLHRITGVDLTALEGLDEPPAWTLISEIGLDLGRWPTVKHVPSWRGRCPHPRVSGGQG